MLFPEYVQPLYFGISLNKFGIVNNSALFLLG